MNDPDGNEPVGEAGKRVAPRDSLLLMARMRVGGSNLPEPVRVRNLSATGLMAECPRPIAAGTAVEIELRNIGWVRGRVAWFAEGRAGVALDVEIDPLTARKPVGAVRPR